MPEHQSTPQPRPHPALHLFETHVERLNSMLAGNWWAVALRGATAIVFGILALLAPGLTILSLIIVFAVAMLIDGALNLVIGFRSVRRKERWGVFVLQGLASLAAAAVALLAPGLTILAFVYLMAIWAVVSGGLALVAAVRLRGDHGRWWLGLSAVLSIGGGTVSWPSACVRRLGSHLGPGRLRACFRRYPPGLRPSPAPAPSGSASGRRRPDTSSCMTASFAQLRGAGLIPATVAASTASGTVCTPNRSMTLAR